MKLKHIFCFLLLSSILQLSTTKAQPIIVDSLSISELVNDVFKGKGVTINSFSYSGDLQSIGRFQDPSGLLQMDTGIIMTTGKIEIAPGPNGAGGAGSAMGGTGDPLIDQILAPYGSTDICRLEIEFTPTSNELLFSYIFASDEYPEYSCSSFNDGFGLFVSGPKINPSGYPADQEYYVDTNIALIPNSTDAVSIRNVNPRPCGSPTYYNANPSGSSQIEYDGYTDFLTTSLEVVPDSTYTLILIIADASDQIFDSGLFLKSKSLVSRPLCPKTASLNATTYCHETRAKLDFTHSSNEVGDYNWTFGDGTTLNGVTTTSLFHLYPAEQLYNCSIEAIFEACTLNRSVGVDLRNVSYPFCSSCDECIGSFAPVPGQKYVISAWAKEKDELLAKATYNNPGIAIYYEGVDIASATFMPKGPIIEGWQRIEEVFEIPDGTSAIQVELINQGTAEVFFDDIRIFPFNANLRSFVYDPVTMRLKAELDENNYATYYEYDEDGNLIRVKKETERGIKTIQENKKRTRKN